MKTVKAGQAVVFVDSVGVPRDALLTYLWPMTRTDTEHPSPAAAPNTSVGTNQEAEYDPSVGMLMVNLVIIKDEKHHDSYGNQVEHQTSIGHKAQATAHGYFWHEKD